MLTILNERIFHNDSTPMRCPLRTVIIASNEIPDEGAVGNLAAMYDRFLLRYQVGYLSNTNLLTLLTRQSPPSPPHIHTITDLQAAEREFSMIPISMTIGEALIGIRQGLAAEGIFPSDRRFANLTKLLQANAWMAGRNTILDEDLELLIHIFWDEPSQINTVKKIVLKAANPQWIKALELFEAAEAIAAGALAVTDDTAKMEKGIEAGAKLKKAIEQLKKLAGGKPGRIADLTATTVQLTRSVVKECCGLELAG